MTITFQYFSNNEHGSDDYRFSQEKDAQEKFISLKALIEVQFQGCSNVEIIDEPDFFGIIDHDTKDWAKVIIST